MSLARLFRGSPFLEHPPSAGVDPDPLVHCSLTAVTAPACWSVTNTGWRVEQVITIML